jgi:hypothetical protein
LRRTKLLILVCANGETSHFTEYRQIEDDEPR